MIASIAAAVAITAFLGADDARPQTAEVDGHVVQVERVTTASPSIQNGKPIKHLCATSAVDPKDAKKSFAYETGHRFVARDAAGKAIPLGRVSSAAFR